jgi:hypothetical protein
METNTIAREAYGRRHTDRGLEARWPGQCETIRAAQLAFGASVLDCALLDTARGGARVHLLAPAEVPEIVTLGLGGECWTLQCRWQRGLEVGFKVVGTNLLPGGG